MRAYLRYGLMKLVCIVFWRFQKSQNHYQKYLHKIHWYPCPFSCLLFLQRLRQVPRFVRTDDKTSKKKVGEKGRKDTTINLSLTKIDQFYFSSYNTPWNVGKNHFGRKNLALQILSDNHFFAKKFRKLPIFALEEIKLKKMQLFQC